jgi:hypothetical protein
MKMQSNNNEYRENSSVGFIALEALNSRTGAFKQLRFKKNHKDQSSFSQQGLEESEQLPKII